MSLTLLRIAGGRHTQAARARRPRPSPRPGPAARRHPAPGRSAALPFSFIRWRFFPPPFLRQGLAQTRPAPLPARTRASGGRLGIPPSLRALARQGDAESEDAESEDSTPPHPKGAREVGTVHPSVRRGGASPRCLRQLPGAGGGVPQTQREKRRSRATGRDPGVRGNPLSIATQCRETSDRGRPGKTRRPTLPGVGSSLCLKGAVYWPFSAKSSIKSNRTREAARPPLTGGAARGGEPNFV